MDDPAEDEDRAAGPGGTVADERKAEELLRAALEGVEAPDDQFVRLGLA